MSRKSRRSNASDGFARKLTWTVLFGLIFGAGLVTGQRLLRNGSTPPLVSVDSDSETSDDEADDTEKPSDETSKDKDQDEGPALSFYDRLSDGVESAADQVEGSGGPETEGSEDRAEETAKYTLQISAYPERDRARTRMRRLEKMGLDPYLVAGELPEEGTYFRVRIGKFSSMEEARTFKRELERKRGVEAAVTPL